MGAIGAGGTSNAGEGVDAGVVSQSRRSRMMESSAMIVLYHARLVPYLLI